jgi:hypothetical protein
MSLDHEMEIGFLNRARKRTVRNWLLRGFAMRDFSPILLGDEPSYEIQLQVIFEHLTVTGKEKFKAATVQAIAEWLSKAYPTEALVSLVYLAAYVRATDAVDTLRVMIESNSLGGLSDEDYYYAMSALIAALAGFAPAPNVRKFFRRLFLSNSFDHRFAGQLFVGLCECEPDNYTAYVPRLLKLMRKFPEDYVPQYVFREFLRVVTLPIVVAHVRELRHNYMRSLLNHLCVPAGSPVDIGMAQNGNLYLILAKDLNSDIAVRTYLPKAIGEDDADAFLLWETKMDQVKQRGGPTRFLRERIMQQVA